MVGDDMPGHPVEISNTESLAILTSSGDVESGPQAWLSLSKIQGSYAMDGMWQLYENEQLQ